MRKLGMLFGVDMLLDTDDKQVADRASKLLAKLFAASFPSVRTDAEYEAEIDKIIN